MTLATSGCLKTKAATMKSTYEKLGCEFSLPYQSEENEREIKPIARDTGGRPNFFAMPRYSCEA